MKKRLLFTALACFILLNAKAQTPSIKWWFNLNDASFGQSAAGDIDGDGLYEIVFG